MVSHVERGTASPATRRLFRGLPLAPSIALLAVFLAGPILYCVYAAFTNMALTGSGATGTDFVGLANFRKAFTEPAFLNAVVLSLLFTLFSAIIGQNILGMLIAFALRRTNKVVRAVVGSIVIGAWVVPEIVAAYMWTAVFGEGGTLNNVLGFFGMPAQDLLYSNPILVVSIANVWRGTAFSMLVYSAALQEIPPEIEEAAEVDGATGLSRFWYITLPIIRRSIMTNLMLITLQTLSVFGLIYAMVGEGGAGNKAQVLPIYMYEQAFKFSQIGYGTAIALVILVVGAAFSLLYLRFLKPETEAAS